jgi:FkbH-like protein
MEIKYSELLKLNKELKDGNSSDQYNIKILSNIIVNQLTQIVEYPLQKRGVNAIASCGNFDNIVQDSIQFNKSNCVLIFWELCNIVDGFQYKSNVLTESEKSAIIEKTKSEIDYTLTNLKSTSIVIINYFSTTVFNHQLIGRNNFDDICRELNNYLESKKTRNVVLFDIDKIFARISVSSCVDFRNYYSSKTLYTLDFFEVYSTMITPIITSVFGKSKKALIFDCDNTLWKGILGEDGETGIDMSGKSTKGVFFEEVQYLAKELASRGIIVGLNSKNNPEDIKKVIREHESMSLKESEIVIEKVNWDDKVSNLKNIADELNIGLDSIVFIDDSDFEINLIKKYLQDVYTIQVPWNLYEYPSLFRKNIDLFYSILSTKDDVARVKSYKNQIVREQAKNSYGSINEYLESLDLEMIIYIDDKDLIERMAQLTQKTNQFNLTTRRYTFTQVEEFVKSNQYITFVFEVNDKFGKFGITGESFVYIKGHEATIDTFLMSCRVLGRNIEFKFLDEIVLYLKRMGIKQIKSSYIKTQKNQQVEDFYECAGFTLTRFFGEVKDYKLVTKNKKNVIINYISVKYEGEN